MERDLVILQIKLVGFPVVTQLISEEEAAAEIRAVESLIQCQLVELEWYSTIGLLQEVEG